MHNESRRSLIKAMALTGAGVLAPSAFHSAHAGSTADIKANRTENGMKQSSLKGNINPVSYTHLTLPTSDLV